jgi:6-phospho-beta-glucosidase
MAHIDKLTILGSGSTYTPELLSGFIEHRDEIKVDQVCLYDIHDERMAIVGGLAQRMFQKAELDTRIELTGELEQAVEGADFIVSQIRVGWMAARILDERIPLRHNVLGQETVGAGGIFNALRSIPVTLRFAQTVARLAPNAWFLNFTNPSGIVTEALIKHSGLTRVVGLCNVPINSQNAIAEMLDVQVDQVWLDWLGLNHLGWIQRIVVAGRDRLPDVLDSLAEDPSQAAHERFPFNSSLLSTLRLLPSSYLRYYYETPEIIASMRKQEKTRGELVAEIEQSLLQKYRDPELTVKPDELRQRGGARYSEAALRLMLSLLNDRRDVQILIVKNDGAISGLPDDVAVEVTAVVGAQGVTPLVQGAPPSQVRDLLEAVKASDILTVDAATSGSRNTAVQAMWANPLVPFELAETLTDELLEAHRRYLPQFYKGMR